MFGAKAQSPYSREALEKEFKDQSALADRSGLNLSFPAEGTYTIRIGGLVPALGGTQTNLNMVSFASRSDMNLGDLAHELRHIAQLQAQGLMWQGIESVYLAQLCYTNPGLLYRIPSSSAYGARLEPGYYN